MDTHPSQANPRVPEILEYAPRRRTTFAERCEKVRHALLRPIPLARWKLFLLVILAVAGSAELIRLHWSSHEHSLARERLRAEMMAVVDALNQPITLPPGAVVIGLNGLEVPDGYDVTMLQNRPAPGVTRSGGEVVMYQQFDRYWLDVSDMEGNWRADLSVAALVEHVASQLPAGRGSERLPHQWMTHGSARVIEYQHGHVVIIAIRQEQSSTLSGGPDVVTLEIYSKHHVPR